MRSQIHTVRVGISVSRRCHQCRASILSRCALPVKEGCCQSAACHLQLGSACTPLQVGKASLCKRQEGFRSGNAGSQDSTALPESAPAARGPQCLCEPQKPRRAVISLCGACLPLELCRPECVRSADGLGGAGQRQLLLTPGVGEGAKQGRRRETTWPARAIRHDCQVSQGCTML